MWEEEGEERGENGRRRGRKKKKVDLDKKQMVKGCDGVTFMVTKLTSPIVDSSSPQNIPLSSKATLFIEVHMSSMVCYNSQLHHEVFFFFFSRYLLKKPNEGSKLQQCRRGRKLKNTNIKYN